MSRLVPSEDGNGISLLELDVLVQGEDAQEGEEDTSCSQEVPGMREKSSTVMSAWKESITLNSTWKEIETVKTL